MTTTDKALEAKARELSRYYPVGTRNIYEDDHERMYQKILAFGQEVREATVRECADILAQHNCTSNCVDSIPTEHCLETAMIEILKLFPSKEPAKEATE